MKKIGLVILAAMAFIMGGVINAHQVSATVNASEIGRASCRERV